MTNARLTKAQAQMLDLLEKQGGRLHIAGISECRTALELDQMGLVELLTNEITMQGGSGVIYRTTEKGEQHD